MEKHIYMNQEDDIIMKRSEFESLQAKFYENGFLQARKETDKISNKYELLKSVLILASKVLEL